MKIIWVDAERGDDASGTGSKEKPYLTIDKGLEDFVSGDQIRFFPGTYIPTDSVVLSGVEGSLSAEDPQSVYIQPEKTTKHQACIAIIESNRFTVQGINILQASDSTGNLIGIYAEDVDNFLCYTCSVSEFTVPSGEGMGIFASGLLGRIENCDVNNFSCAGNNTYGIKTRGISVIDCSAANVSGVNYCYPIFAQGLKNA